MFGRLVDFSLLIGALIGLMVTGWWTVYAGPNNAASLQNRLQTQAETALHDAGHDWARVDMDGQYARLSGQTPSIEADEAALESLGRASLFLGGITKITSEVASAPPISPYVLTAKKDSENGMLVLSGHAPDSATRTKIEQRAEKIAPGHVSTQLKIGTGEPLGDWQEVVLAGLDQLKPLKSGELRLIDSNIYLSGQSGAEGVDTSALEAFTPPAGKYDLNVDVLGPALWSARHQDGALVLSGSVKNDGQREALLALARENFSGDVRDDMHLEAGRADNWLVTARSLLPGFANFQSGTLSFAPESGGFTVSGETTGSVEAYLREDLIEGDYPVQFAIVTRSAGGAELAGLDFENNRLEACQSGFDAVMAANKITFESSKATISRESGATLDKVAAVADNCTDVLIEVRGHTDNAGDRNYNIGLSKDRAGAVKAYMVARGFPADKLEIIGFGPDVPIANNANRAGRAANRRIEFKIVKEG